MRRGFQKVNLWKNKHRGVREENEEETKRWDLEGTWEGTVWEAGRELSSRRKSQERTASLKPGPENFRKNTVNTVKSHRETKKTAKGSVVGRSCAMLVNTDWMEGTSSAPQRTLRNLVVKGRELGLNKQWCRARDFVESCIFMCTKILSHDCVQLYLLSLHPSYPFLCHLTPNTRLISSLRYILPDFTPCL